MNISFNHIYGNLISGNGYTITRRQTKQFEDEEAVSNGNQAKKLRDMCRTLSRSDFSAGASTNIISKLMKFNESYNKLAEAAEKSTDKTLKKQVDSITKLLTENKKALKKAGIDFDEDKNRLTLVDEEKLEKIKNGKTLESIFTGLNSIGSKIQKLADKSYNLLKNEVVNKEVPVYQNIQVSANNRTNALTTGALYSNITTLAGMSYIDDNKSTIVTLLNTFAGKYNELINMDITDEDADDTTTQKRTEYIDNIRTASDTYSEQLNDIGITVNDDKTLTIDSSKLEDAVTDNIKDLFEKNGEYNNIIGSNLNLLFASLSGAAGSGQAVNITA